MAVASGRWMDLRQPLRDVMGTKFELRLGDPTDSAIDRKLATLVPENRPGRGLEVEKHHALVALPRVDHVSDAASLGDGVTDALRRISEAWSGSPAQRLKLLPVKVGLDELRARAPEQKAMILGLEERHLDVLTFDRGVDHHLIVLGDTKSGKTTLLRALVNEITRTTTPSETQVYVVDLRRTLLGIVPEDYLGGYLATRDDVADMLGGLVEYLQTRLPGRDVTAEQLRKRSWWSGPEAWVIIDDYDLVATASGNPAAGLQQLLAQAGDVGLHVVLARRSGGVSRQLFEPVLQGLIELGTMSVLLSGSPDEGQVLPGVKFRRAIPGRAQVISRDNGVMVAQMAWVEPLA